MATGTLVFGFQTQIKNVLDPTAATDAATKEYVDSKTGSGATLGASGSDTDIQFNQTGNISANGNLTYDYGNSILTVIGNLVSSNANLGNAVTANFYLGDGGLLSNIKSDGGFANTVANSAQPNITSLGNLVNLQIGNSSTGTVVFDGTGDANLTGNLNANGNIIANGNITANNANFVTLLVGNTSSNVYIDNAGDINAAGNITVGTGTGGTITGANSIVANYFVGDGSLLTNLPLVNDANFSNYAGNVTVSSQPNITSVGNLISLIVVGNLTSGNANLGNLATANYFSGDGGLLSNIASGNITGTVANANYAAYAGNVTVNAQPNITSLGALATNLSWTSSSGVGAPTFTTSSAGSKLILYPQVNASNVDYAIGIDIATLWHSVPQANGYYNFDWYGGTTLAAQLNGNGYMNVTGNFSAANINAGNVLTANYTNAVLTTAAQPNITSIGNLVSLKVNGISNLNSISNVVITGGMSGQYLQTDGNGNLSWSTVSLSNIRNGSYGVSVNSAGLVTINTDGNIIGNLVVNANLTVDGNGFANSFTVTQNFLSQGNANFEGNVAISTVLDSTNSTTGALVITSGGLGVFGNINAGNHINGNTLGGTLTTASQPNITSVGTLGNLSVTSNVSAGNIKTDNLLHSDGTAWDFVTASGSNHYIQYSDGANLASSANLTYDDHSQTLTVEGNIVIGTGSGGNIDGVDYITANYFVGNANSLSNIPVANITGTTLPSTIVYSSLTTVGTLTSLTVANTGTGNITSDNANLGNLATANYFSGNGSLLSHLTGSNVSGQVANANIADQVYTSSQPNITNVGNLISLTVIGNTSLGNVGNVNITGGMSGQYLQTDGTGNLIWATVSTSTLENGSSNISIADNGNISFGVDGTPDAVVFATDGSITLSSGNINGANVVNANTVVLESMISGASSITISNSDTLIDQFPKSLYRTAKYIISARNHDGYEAVEVLLIHDDSISFITTYGDISTGTVEDIITLSSNIVGGNICLYAQGSNSTTYVKLISTYVTD